MMKEFLKKLYLERNALWTRNLDNKLNEKNRLKTFKMWCFRKMFKVPLTERVADKEVLDKIKEQRQI